jgi:PAS domain S-box-containing protein
MAGQNRDEKIAKSDPSVRPALEGIFGYALSVLLVALSTGVTLLLQDYTFRTPLFLPAILLSTWLGGTGPGLLAVLLSTLSINFFFLEPRFAFAFSFRDFVHLAVFLFTALLISSWSTGRRRAERALKRARDELEEKVEERTADLGRTNERLRQEVAERERSEDVLREQASLLNLTHDTVFVRDMNDVITYWNRGAEERYGWSSEEAVGRVSHELTQTSFPKALQEINAELLQTGRWQGELVHIRRDRTPVMVASRWSLQRDESGNPIAILETNNDITDRKQAEEKVRASEQKYRDLINASPDAICVIDADSKIILVNPAGVDLAGRPEHELIGFYITDTYVPEEFHLFRDRIDKLKAEGSFRFERKFVRGNGEVIPVEVSLSALRGRHYQAIIRDISQRKRREAILAEENRVLEMVAKGDSLADILDNLCRLVEELSSGVLASILLMDPNGKQLRHGAAPNLPKAYTDAIDGLVIGHSVGSCGSAAYRAEQVIVSDIATDPLWDPFRDLALTHSLRACWSTPIFSEDKVIGTFAMYYREPRSPSPPEQETIKHITHLAGIAIQRKRSEAALRASEQIARGQVEALAQSLDVLATAPEPEKFIGQMLNTIGRLLNAQNVSLWLFDESNDSLSLRSSTSDSGKSTAPDPKHPFMKNPSVFWKENPVVQEMLFTAGPLVCDDVDTDPRVGGEWGEYLKRNGTKRFLGVPLLVGGHVRGFVSIRHVDRASYRPEEIELTQALAHQVMLALQLNEFAEQG